MNRRIAGGLLAVAALTVIVAVALPGAPRPSTLPVTRSDVRVTVQATGRLDAEVAYEIGPPSVSNVWNYNLKWMIPEGTKVARGDVVARFDTTQLDERLRENRAQLQKTLEGREKEERSLELRLKQRRLDLVEARGELKKVDVELAVPAGLVSDIELGQRRADAELARRRVEHLEQKADFERRLVASKLELLDVQRRRVEQRIAELEDAIARHAVSAPVDGVVIYIPKQDGNRWEVGERVWMLAKLLKVADVSTLRAEAQLLEVDAAQVRVGQQARVRVDAVPGLVIHTRVGELGRLVRERSVQDRSKVFDAFLPLPEPDPELLRPGMGVTAEIEISVLPGALTVPVEAVRLTAEGPVVQVLDGAGPDGRRPVELGPRTGGLVVVESGLSEGERVVLPGRDRT